MVRFTHGDMAAFEALYRRHEVRVYRFLLHQVRDSALANDVMQEVWLAVVRSVDRYQPTAKFTTWLFGIAHHKSIDALRALGASTSAPLTAEDDPMLDTMTADPSAEPLQRLQTREQAVAVLQALAVLPVEQRAAFLLHAQGELSVEEIAHATGTTFETAKSRLRYARGKLRQLLAELT